MSYANLVVFAFIGVILLTGLASAQVDRDIYIIDSDGSVTYKYQYALAVERGYYLEKQEVLLPVPPEVTDIEFYGAANHIDIDDPVEVDEDGFRYYLAEVRRTEYNNPQGVGYMYESPDLAASRYKENYFLDFIQYIHAGAPQEVYICYPRTMTKGADSYDSSPDEELPQNELSDIYDLEVIYPDQFRYRNVHSFFASSSGDKSVETQLNDFNPCPGDYNGFELLGLVPGKEQRIELDFSDPSHATSLSSRSGRSSTVVFPSVYQNKIQQSFPYIDVLISELDDSLNLDTPTAYSLSFVGKNDEVLGSDEMVSYSSGKVFYTTSILTQSSQIIQVNLLRGIINSAIVQTYGTELYNNWWVNGVLTSLALDVMQENHLATNEIEELLEEGSKLGSEQNKSTAGEGLSTTVQTLVESAIVSEIEDICPGHALKLNERVQAGIDFDSDYQFNNFLLYQLRNSCEESPVAVLDKYDLSHADIGLLIDKKNMLSSKIDGLSSYPVEIAEVTEIRDLITDASNLLEEGKARSALSKLEAASGIYNESLQEKLELWNQLEHRLSAIDNVSAYQQYPLTWMAEDNIQEAMTAVENKERKELDTQVEELDTLIDRSGLYATVMYAVVILLIGGVIIAIKNRDKKFTNKS